METGRNTILIPNDLCRKSGIATTWQPINQLGVFPYHYKNLATVSKDEPSPFAPTDAKIFDLRQETILFEPVLRKLVNEANDTFLSVQTLMSATENDVEHKVELLKLSRQYRSIVRACLENLQSEVLKGKNRTQEQLQNYVTIFYSVECIWHLCEILFVDNVPGGFVLPHLLEWVRFHFPKYERNAASMLAGDLVRLELHDEYWETVIGSLLQGRIEVVRALLRLHSAAHSGAFKMVDQILKAMPVYNVFSGLSMTEYNVRRKQWLVDTESKVDSKVFVTEKKLDLITKLIINDESAWEEIQDSCETWYEYLAGYLFFSDPTIEAYRLGDAAKECIAKLGVRNQMKHLDTVLIAAMESNIYQVIEEIQHMAENGWFVTHLTDLLYHAGYFNTLETNTEELLGGKLREFFILDYGTLLAGHHSLWQVGVSYLDSCPRFGLKTIELLLPRLPLGSEARTHKIIREALKRNLDSVAQGICKVQGVASLKRGRLGNALNWALKSQDGAFISYLAEEYLKRYRNSGKLQNVDLLDNLGSCMLLSDRLVFLGKYCEFHRVYQNKQYREAAEVLVSLISSKLTPKYFWLTLLTDALPLLECDDLLLSSEETYLLMNCLEEKHVEPELRDKIELIRLALARNLARALTHEAEMYCT